MFDPSIGRWLEMDPIAFDAGDANLYRYAGNNPTNAKDPTGLKWDLYDWQIQPANRKIICTLQISFYDKAKGTLATSALVQHWKDVIEKVWSGPGHDKDGVRWDVVVQVDTEISTGNYFNKYKNSVQVMPRGWRFGGNPGGTRAVTNMDTHYGEWAVDSTDILVAHEAGHFLGHESYHDGSRDWPGFEGTIMAITPGEVVVGQRIIPLDSGRLENLVRKNPVDVKTSEGWTFRDKLVQDIFIHEKDWQAEKEILKIIQSPDNPPPFPLGVAGY
jgi:hypothetical protein